VYCCQYRESDYAFISRLLAEDGIIFTITHDEDVDKVVLGDEPNGFGDIAPGVVPFVTLQGFDTLKPSVGELMRARKIVTDKVVVRDYDFDSRPTPKAATTARMRSSSTTFRRGWSTTGWRSSAPRRC
jgi:type VI secretion system secreted protein VgrG